MTARFAVKQDTTVFDMDIGFRVLALFAENELADEAVQIVLQFASVVGAVDDPTIIVRISVSLSTKLETKVLDDV